MLIMDPVKMKWMFGMHGQQMPCTALDWIGLQDCIALHCIALHCIALIIPWIRPRSISLMNDEWVIINHCHDDSYDDTTRPEFEWGASESR